MTRLWAIGFGIALLAAAAAVLFLVAFELLSGLLLDGSAGK